MSVAGALARLVAWRLAFLVPLLLVVTAGMFALAKASPLTRYGSTWASGRW